MPLDCADSGELMRVFEHVIGRFLHLDFGRILFFSTVLTIATAPAIWQPDYIVFPIHSFLYNIIYSFFCSIRKFRVNIGFSVCTHFKPKRLYGCIRSNIVSIWFFYIRLKYGTQHNANNLDASPLFDTQLHVNANFIFPERFTEVLSFRKRQKYHEPQWRIEDAVKWWICWEVDAMLITKAGFVSVAYLNIIYLDSMECIAIAQGALQGISCQHLLFTWNLHTFFSNANRQPTSFAMSHESFRWTSTLNES